MGSSSKDDVQVSYDVSNEFFRLWLDERMNYTCGVFESTDNLEEAQVKKLEVVHAFARVTPDKRVLDIGCGWGANIEFLALDKGVKDVHGVTQSSAQYAEIQRRAVPNVTAHCMDVFDYEPKAPFDALTSIEQDVSPEYFRRAHEITTPGAFFGLQTVLGDADMGMEDIVAAVKPYFEVIEVRTRREDYQKTCWHWRDRMRKNETLIREKWGDAVFDDYDRHLTARIEAFDEHHQSLAQWSLRRID